MLSNSCKALLGAALLFLSLASPLFAQSVTVSTAEDIERDLALVPCKSSDRLLAVQALFRKLGATDDDILVSDRKKTKNVIVTKKGTSPETIVVGAHYDKLGDGCGAIDNWTGIVALAHFYGTLRSVSTTKTFKFIAFDKEEPGLIGSGVFVGDIPKAERATYCAMVNVDSFGFTLPWVMGNTSDKKMIAAAKDFWKEMKLELTSVDIPNADADSSSFRKAGIPAITFAGLDGKWEHYLHSSNDQLKNINPSTVFAGYRFVLPFLTHIDTMACTDFRK